MKDNGLLIFILTAVLDVVVSLIAIEVLAMIYLGVLEMASIYIILASVPAIFTVEGIINKLKKDEELK